jgi:biopolymer transport protein ExbD
VKRRQIFIELTSLLDVILIMLFILLTQARTRTAEALDTAALAESDAAALRMELTAAYDEQDVLQARIDAQEERADALQRQLWTENLVLDNSLLLTVSVDKSGQIRLETEGEAATIPYDWAEDTYAKNRLRGLLLDKLKGTDQEAVFLVFQYDRARVYHAEYNMIEDIIQEVKRVARERDIPLSVLELDLQDA